MNHEYYRFLVRRIYKRNDIETNKKEETIAILGSTGSIGTQALQVIEEHPDLYDAYADGQQSCGAADLAQGAGSFSRKLS